MREALAARPEFRFSEFEGMTVGCYMIAGDDTFSCPVSLECRGITFGADGEVIGRPLPKFFNVGERSETMPDAIDWSLVDEVYEKLDGSLIHTVKTGGGYRLKSKKSFTAPQVLAAQQWVDERPGFGQFLMEMIELDMTVIMEWTAPDNRVVLQYDKPQLTVLHARHTPTGRYAHRGMLETRCGVVGVPLVATVVLDRNNLLALAKSTEGVEGWVLQFRDDTLMKLKTQWYLERHHYMTSLRERDVARAVLEEKLDDIKTVLGADEPAVLERCLRIEREVVMEIDQIVLEVDALFATTVGKDRKAIAFENREHALFPLLMKRVSGKEPDFKSYYAKHRLETRWGLEPVTTFRRGQPAAAGGGDD